MPRKAPTTKQALHNERRSRSRVNTTPLKTTRLHSLSPAKKGETTFDLTDQISYQFISLAVPIFIIDVRRWKLPYPNIPYPSLSYARLGSLKNLKHLPSRMGIRRPPQIVR